MNPTSATHGLRTAAWRRPVLPALVLALALTMGLSLQRTVWAETPEELYKQALTAYAGKDYVKAQELLEKIHKDSPNFANATDVSLKLVDCMRRTIQAAGKFEQWQDADDILTALLAKKDLPELDAARAQRLRANLQFEWPHWGYKTNAKFSRGDYRGGGDYKDTFVEDRETALDSIRASRNLYEKMFASLPAAAPATAKPRQDMALETIDMYFDLGRIAAWDNANLYQAPPHAPQDKELPAKVTWQDTLSDKGLWTYATQRIGELDPTPGKACALRASYLHAMFLKRYYALNNGAPFENLTKLPDSENPYKLLLTTYQNAPALPAGTAKAELSEDIGPECLYAAGMLMQDLQQYTTAIDHFKTLIEERPNSKWKSLADSAIHSINTPVLNFAGGVGSQTLTEIDDTGKVTPRKVSLSLQLRNVDEVTFHATPVDLRKALVDSSGNYWQLFNLYYYDRKNKVDTVLDYKTGEVETFTRKIENAADHKVKTQEIELPFTKPGAWVVEAEIKDVKVRQLIVTSDLIILSRMTSDKPVIFVADAVTGKPAEGVDVKFYEQWWNNKQQQKELGAATVGADGTVALPAGANGNGHSVMIAAMREDPKTKELTSFAFTQPQWMGAQTWNPGQVTKIFSVTDRPVYRPGQVVKFKHTVREFKDEDYTNPGAGAKVHVMITDSKGAKLYDQNLDTNAFGTVFGEFKLSETATLGQYMIQVFMDNARWNCQTNGGNVFRVEEYKKPEYEVTVKADTQQAKIGSQVHAKISAKYYYGAPVTQATVQYKVQRKQYNYSWTPEGPWTWLYGPCYGCCWYWRYWWYQAPVPDQELIMEGEAPIGPDGTLTINIDTADSAKRFPDMDHEFEISATVRDQSRRNIDGTGSVIVTRSPYYAILSTDYGYCWWSNANQKVSVRVMTQKPDGTPVASKGSVEVYRTDWNWQGNSERREKIETKDFSVDESGSATYSFQAPTPGQYEVVYKSQSDWGTEVTGSSRVWAYGEGFDGRKYKTGDLEIILDKRSYSVGDTAKVMINTGTPGGTVLLFNELWYQVRDYKILKMEAKTMVVEIPITKADVPNFFLSAVTVRNGHIVQQDREVCVPPVDQFLDLKVTADKASYKPGELMNLDVVAKDADGKPAVAEFDLSVFDKSILYIQPEYGSEIRTWFHGQRRQHWGGLLTSQNQLGWPVQWFDPQYGRYGLSYPPAWLGDWGTAGEFGAGGLMAEGGEMDDEAGSLGPVSAPVQNGGGRFPRGPMGGARYAMDGAPGAMRMEEAKGAPAAPTAAAAPMEQNAQAGHAAAPEQFAAAVVRSNFADAAFWAPTVVTDKEGHASVKVPMPENLTGWVVNSHAITAGALVAKARVEVVTAKNLLVRLQTPRFIVQHDEVVISANIMNYLAKDKQAKVTLKVGGKAAEIAGDDTRTVSVPASGEARVDWTLHVNRPGKIELVATALTDEESDAMKVEFPAVVYGMPVTITQTKTLAYGEDNATLKMGIALPEKFDPEQSKLEVSYTPTLAGGMLEAMPYLVAYPYGCTEQTMSRYLPTVMVSDTLEKTGINLEDIRTKGTKPSPEVMGRNAYYYPRYYQNPVFDKAEVNKMVHAGLERLYSFQHPDGGWGWWKDDKSSPYMTAYVTYGLQIGKRAKQPVDANTLQQGYNYLSQVVQSMDFKKAVEGYDYQVRGPEGMAFIGVSLSGGGIKNDPLANFLVAQQDKMSDYGRALSVCALSQWGRTDDAKKALSSLLSHIDENKEFDTASLRQPHQENYCYWYWYNNNIEANAWTLKAIMAVQPDSELAPKLVRWLLAQRHGFQWYDTRDTAMCLYAMTDYLEKSKEANCDYSLEVEHEGVKKTVAISAANLFNFDSRFVLEGEDVLGGKPDAAGHKSVDVSMTRTGKGAVYATMALQVYSQDENIPASGNQMSIGRKYYKLTPRTVIKKTRNAQGEMVEMPVFEYDRAELKSGDPLKSGDRIEVELNLTTPFEYEYLAIEDWKPAGCEPVDLTSDTEQGVNAWWTHRELRDQKVTFFVTWLNRGKATLTYQLRAETPGLFHVLPTKAYLMYTPEIEANSESFTMPIKDTPAGK